MDLGLKIKNARKNKGLTQKQLAQILGVSVITIQNYENSRRNPSVDVLKKISEILDVNTSVLLNDNSFKYELINNYDFTEKILDYLGYSLIEKRLLDDSYIYVLTNIKNNEKISLSAEEIDYFIIDLKDVINFEVSKLIERSKRSRISELTLLYKDINKVANFKQLSENNWHVSASIGLDENGNMKIIDKDGFNSKDDASEFIRKILLDELLFKMEFNRGKL